MPDGQTFTLDDVVAHPEFQEMGLQDKNDFLMQHVPEYSQGAPKDRSDLLNTIHYSGNRAPTVPSTEPGQKTSPALGREFALGAMGTIAPESEHPLQDIASSEISKAKSPSEWLTQAIPGANIARTALGLGKALYGGVKEMAPAMAQIPMHGAGQPMTPEEAEQAAHGAGTIAGFGAMAAAPELRDKAVEVTAPWRNARAERMYNSIIGPEPRNIFEVSRPAPALVKEGPIGMTTKGLLKSVQGKIDEHNAVVQDALKQAHGAAPEPLAPIVVNATDPIIKLARANGYESVAKQVENWRDNYLQNHPAQLPLDELYKLKQDLGKAGKAFKGGPTEEVGVKAATQRTVTEINNALGKRIPGLRDITQRESGLIQAADMLENKARIEAGGPVLIPGARIFGGLTGESGGLGMSGRFNPLPDTLLKSGLGKLLGTREPLPPPVVPPAMGAGQAIPGVPPGGPPPPPPRPRPGGRVVSAQVVNPAGPPVSPQPQSLLPPAPAMNVGGVASVPPQAAPPVAPVMPREAAPPPIVPQGIARPPEPAPVAPPEPAKVSAAPSPIAQVKVAPAKAVEPPAASAVAPPESAQPPAKGIVPAETPAIAKQAVAEKAATGPESDMQIHGVEDIRTDPWTKKPSIKVEITLNRQSPLVRELFTPNENGEVLHKNIVKKLLPEFADKITKAEFRQRDAASASAFHEGQNPLTIEFDSKESAEAARNRLLEISRPTSGELPAPSPAARTEAPPEPVKGETEQKGGGEKATPAGEYRLGTTDPVKLSDDEIAKEKAEIAKITHPLYDKLEAMGDAAFRKNDPQVRYTPEAQAISDQIKPFENRNHSLDYEAKYRQQKIANQAASEARDKRVAEAEVSQRRNGWEIVNEGGEYVLRDPATKEEVYRGRLTRVRQVADESAPESQTPPPAPLRPRKPAERQEVEPIRAPRAIESQDIRSLKNRAEQEARTAEQSRFSKPKVNKKTGLTNAQQDYLAAKLVDVSEDLKPHPRTLLREGDRVVRGNDSLNREGIIVSGPQVPASGKNAGLSIYEVKFGDKVEEVPSHNLAHAETEPQTIKIPGDGEYKVNSQEQANALHRGITGQPMPGIPEPATFPRMGGKQYRETPTPPTIEQHADTAEKLYGTPGAAHKALKAQLEAVEQDPQSFPDLNKYQLESVIDELNNRVEGKATRDTGIVTRAMGYRTTQTKPYEFSPPEKALTPAGQTEIERYKLEKSARDKQAEIDERTELESLQREESTKVLENIQRMPDLYSKKQINMEIERAKARGVEIPDAVTKLASKAKETVEKGAKREQAVKLATEQIRGKEGWLAPQVRVEVGGKEFLINTGAIAKQAGLEPVPGSINQFRKIEPKK